MHDSRTTVIGNVITDPQSRTTRTGACAVSFRVASTRRRLDRASGEWVDADQLYLSVQCWGELGAGVAYSLRKGDPVVVTGRLRTREWETEGQRRSVVELEADAVGPDLTRSLARVQRVQRATRGNSEDGTVRQSVRPEDNDVRQAVGSLHPV